MKRRINSTDRKKIKQSDISIVSTEAKNCFEMKLSLKEYKFLQRANIVVEVTCSRNSKVWRFDKIGQLKDYKNTDYEVTFPIALSDVPSQNFTFKIKIVDEAEEIGKILGFAKIQYSPRTGLKEQSFFAVDTNVELGDVPWKLDFSNNDLCLHVNEKCGELCEKLSSDPVIQSLLVPTILRMALERAIQCGLSSEDEESENDENCALLDCLKFGKAIHPENEEWPESDDIDERDRWIEGVIDAFCQKFHFLDNLANTLGLSNREAD